MILLQQLATREFGYKITNTATDLFLSVKSMLSLVIELIEQGQKSSSRGHAGCSKYLTCSCDMEPIKNQYVDVL